MTIKYYGGLIGFLLSSNATLQNVTLTGSLTSFGSSTNYSGYYGQLVMYANASNLTINNLTST